VFENGPLIDLAVGRSTVRQRILALLMDESSGRLHLREIQRRAETSPGTASRELGKLVAAGLIEREAEGNQVYFRASVSPFATMMRSLLVARPAPELKERPPRLPAAKPAPTGPTTAPALQPMPTGTQLAESTVSDEAPPPSQEAGVFLSGATPDPLGLGIASRLADSVRPLYGEALRGIYLHGARAAGPAAADAEVEIIIVLDKVERYGAELERTSQICAALAHELQLVVSRIFVAEADWNGATGGVPPLVRREAVSV
jgi:DNA-binding transcriptional ArsR family regulator